MVLAHLSSLDSATKCSLEHIDQIEAEALLTSLGAHANTEFRALMDLKLHAHTTLANSVPVAQASAQNLHWRSTSKYN